MKGSHYSSFNSRDNLPFGKAKKPFITIVVMFMLVPFLYIHFFFKNAVKCHILGQFDRHIGLDSRD